MSTSKDLKKVKIQNKDILPSKNQTTNEEININTLNNDCLTYIFEHLSFQDKLNLEFVCKRWNIVSKLSWNHVKTFEMDESFLKKYLSKNEEQKNTAFIVSILRRCGVYLEKLIFESNSWFDVLKIINDSANYCGNLTVLYFYRINISESCLKLWFRNNKNLKNVSLNNLKLNTSSLASLNKCLIEVFILNNCGVDSTEKLSKFLSQLKNIKILEIDSYGYDLNYFVSALNIGRIKSLVELRLIKNNSKPLDINKLSKLLIRQKQLRKINFDFDIPIKLIEVISSFDHLEEINYKWLSEWHQGVNDDFLNSLYKFKNLKTLNCFFKVFTDECFKSITKCINLKELNLEISYYYLTPEVENYFTSLENIQFLTLDFAFKLGFSHYKILLAVNKCEKLKLLYIRNILFNEREIMEFDYFPNLETLKVGGSNITSQILTNIITKSPKLKYCEIEKCRNIDAEFINLISSIKNKNNVANNILNLEFRDIHIEKNKLSEISPFLSVSINNSLFYYLHLNNDKYINN